MIKNLYIDYSHLCYRTLFAVQNDIKEVGYGIMKHSILKNVLYSINKFNPDKVFICCDSKLNWRKKLYADYKGQRKEAKDKLDIDWEKFYETVLDVSSGFKVAFPFYVITIPYLEADDVIAALVRKNNKEEEHTVITSDGDYKQLLQYKNTKIYDAMTKNFMKSENPFYDLEVKIIMGDKGDNIPAIATRIGIETAKKLVDGSDSYKKQTLVQLMENSEVKKNYERNKKLIDLSKTPKQLVDLLDKEISEYNLATTKGMYHYFIDNGMRDLFSRIDEITRSLAHLNPNSKRKEESIESSIGSFSDLL